VKALFGFGWAQPVKRRRWAFAAVALHTLMRATGYRMSGRPAGYAWQRAVGVS